MTVDHHKIVRDITTKVAVQLFEAYGVVLGPATEVEPSSLALCGVIGFTGDLLCGSLVMAVTADVLAASDPVAARPSRDWMAELTNQLLGRLKNQLLPWGAAIHMSLPVVLRGEHISPVPSSANGGAQTFRSANGGVYVWVEAVMVEGGALNEQASDERVPDEGTALMF
jgi:hypothetical protein